MVMWKDEQSANQESLQQAVRAVLQRQLATFLALTLALIVPLSCDHHGMMNLFDLDPASAMHAGHHAPGQGSSCVYDHTVTPGISMSVLASAGLTPSGPALPPVMGTPTGRPEGPLYPAQPDQVPPDQPPRLR